MKWTKAMVDAQNARVESISALKPDAVPDDAAAIEGDLHAEIIAECKRNNWIYFHGSMAHRTFRTLGEPDFIILMNGGRKLMIECKTKTGKLSETQTALAHWAARLGHQIHVVRSFKQFLTLVQPQEK